MKIFVKPLKYDRTGILILEQDKCDVCSTKLICLKVDTSNEEYGSISICRYCIDRAFNKYIDELTTKAMTGDAIT